MNSSNPETAEHHWFPFLRYKKKCDAAGKEVSVNEWMRTTGQLDAKIGRVGGAEQGAARGAGAAQSSERGNGGAAQRAGRAARVGSRREYAAD